MRVAGYAIAVALAVSPRTYAHHSFAAEFDANSPVQLEGAVTKLEWVNPHVFIHIKVQTKDHTTQPWAIETGSPNTLTRSGFKRDSVKIGTVIVVRGFQSKDHSCKPECQANGRSVILPNGQRLFVGSPGTGAPDDGAESSK